MSESGPRMQLSTVTVDITTPEGWESLRRWLVGHRKRLRLTQADVAVLMRTTQSEVSKFEAGETNPRVSTIQRYCHAVGLRPDLVAAPVSS